MAVTNPDVHPYQGSSMFVVPVSTPGVTIVRDVGSMDDPRVVYGRFGNHAENAYEAARARINDGPDEVPRQTVARQTLKGYPASEVPTEFVPARAAAAREKFAEALELLTAANA